MSSWFSSLSEKVTLAAEKVSSALHDDTLLEKLTLTTPELKAERQALDASERRKEHVRNMLAGMLPWETRDPERDILVEECRDAVLQLSNDKTTFFGPYRMPKMDANVEDDKDDNTNDKIEKDEAQKEREEAARLDPYDPIQPSPDSLEKLAKLEPLPSLLQDFDFSAHVGLIERILAEDKQLVKMQSSLSGGGARERIFWRNYFFHCAFTRYEAGLSIDEIWGDMTEEERAAAARQAVKQQVEAAAAAAAATTTVTNDVEEETITFDHEPDESDNIIVSQQEQSSAKSSPEADNSSNKSYEIVDGEISPSAEDASGADQEAANDDDDLAAADDDENDDDYELDELEAEIARELED